MSDSRRHRGVGRALRVLFPLLWIVLLDASFDSYFWRVPNLTLPREDFGYQFLSELHQLEGRRTAGSVRILGLGSSVAVAFDPEQVQGLLRSETAEINADVHRLLLPGIKPSDYRLFFDAAREATRPDLVVILLNTADFLNPSIEQDLKQQVRYVLPPWRTLLERYENIRTVSGKLDLLLAGASHLYRYRKLIRSCLQNHAKFALQWIRRTGEPGPFGVYADGYAKQQFALPVGSTGEAELNYYVHPAWIDQRGSVALTASSDGRVLAETVETEPGWKALRLDLPSGANRLVEVAADSYWCPRAAAVGRDVRMLGVRLREVRPEWVNGRAPPLRYPPVLDGQLRLRMGDAIGEEYLRLWDQELHGDTNFANMMRFYQRTKIALAHEEFRGGGEYAELDRLVAGFVADGTKVILVNSAESPLLLREYRDTPYYRGHLNALRNIAATYPGVQFHDLSTVLPAEDFNDWHHVNYIGTLKLGVRVAEIIRTALVQR